VGHKLLLQRAKLFEILQGDIKAKMTQHLYNFHMSEEINTFCHTVWKQSVQGSLSGCRFGLFLLWQPLQCLCILQLPKGACSVTMLLELLLPTKVLRESLSLGQFYKLKIPACVMTGSSAKSFNLIFKCFEVTEVPFFAAKKEQQV